MAKKRTQSLMPFDTGEWMESPRINTLSFEMQGVWVTLLCYMWQSPEKGVLLRPNGTPYTIKEIARLLGLPNTRIIDTLMEKELLLKNDKGYFNPDMVKRADLSNKRRMAGAKGGESRVSRQVKTANPIEQPPAIPIAPDQSALEIEVSQPPEQTESPRPPKKAKSKEKVKHRYAELVMMTEKEYTTLCDEFTEPAAQRMITILSEYKQMKGATYKCDYLAIRKWVIRAYFEEQEKYGSKQYPINTRTGVANSSGYATGTLPFEPTTGSQSGNAQESGYNERF